MSKIVRSIGIGLAVAAVSVTAVAKKEGKKEGSKAARDVASQGLVRCSDATGNLRVVLRANNARSLKGNAIGTVIREGIPFEASVEPRKVHEVAESETVVWHMTVTIGAGAGTESYFVICE